jgi:hypothetical protein
LTSLLLALCISGSLLSGCKGKGSDTTETTTDKTTVETTEDPRSESSESSSEAPSVTTSSETSETSESTTETEPLDPKKQEAIEAAKAHGLTEEDLGGEYEIFLKFQEALEENTAVGEYKEFIYRIFPAIAYASEYVDDSYFFQRVSSLSITKDELEDSINGQYNSENNLYLKTSLFENDPDPVQKGLFRWFDPLRGTGPVIDHAYQHTVAFFPAAVDLPHAETVRHDTPAGIETPAFVQESQFDNIHACFLQALVNTDQIVMPEIPVIYISAVTECTVQ